MTYNKLLEKEGYGKDELEYITKCSIIQTVLNNCCRCKLLAPEQFQRLYQILVYTLEVDLNEKEG